MWYHALKDNYSIYLSVYPEESICNVYENKEPVLAYGGTLEECIDKIQQSIQK